MSASALLVAQSEQITNWLTPVWLLCLGISIGFLLAVIGIAKIYVGQKIAGLNSVAQNRGQFVAVGMVTSIVYLALFLAVYYWRFGADAFDESLAVPLMVVVPACLLLGFGVWKLVSRKLVGEIDGLIYEGFLSWLNRICFVAIAFTLLGFVLAAVNGFGVAEIVDEPGQMLKSLARLPFTGKIEHEFEIPPSPKSHGGDAVQLEFDGDELQSLGVLTDQRLEVAAQPITAEMERWKLLQFSSSDDVQKFYQRDNIYSPIPLETVSQLYINNLGSRPASVRMTLDIAPTVQQVWIVPAAAVSVAVVYIGYLVLMTLFPKVAAIAQATFKTEISQPLYLLVLVVGAAFILLSIYVPYNTFGEDIKMYKDSGLTLIRVLAIFTAIWAASKSVAEEIDGRTALTVLSKPVGRRQFVLGKFSGIGLAIGLLFVALGLWFFTWVAYKPIYDYREGAKGMAEWTLCFNEAVHIIPGIFLCFLEVLIFVAISVAISTRLGILANFLICFSIYVLGHLTPLIVQSSLAAFEPVQVFGQLIAIVFPVLDHFDVHAAINTNSPVPSAYLIWSVIYTALYGGITLLLALILFEDRDLA